MALVIADRVKDTTTSVGTGTITLSGSPPAGFQSFAAVGNGNTTYYTIAGQGTSEWEVGIGTYSSTGPTLSRDTVLSSSAGGTTKVDFSAGIKDVFVTLPSERTVTSGATTDLVLPAPGTSGNVLTSNGSSWVSQLGATAANVQTFTSSGTWTKPSGAQFVLVECWGAGGGGGRPTAGASNPSGAGGGGGSYSYALFAASSLSSAVPVTIGAGGTGGFSNGGSGNTGGNTDFGKLLYGYGGGGGQGNATTSGIQFAGGGGGTLGAGHGGTGGAPRIEDVGTTTSIILAQDMGGGKGGGQNVAGAASYNEPTGAASGFGGGGGCGTFTSVGVGSGSGGGSSTFGGGGGGAGGYSSTGGSSTGDRAATQGGGPVPVFRGTGYGAAGGGGIGPFGLTTPYPANMFQGGGGGHPAASFTSYSDGSIFLANNGAQTVLTGPLQSPGGGQPTNFLFVSSNGLGNYTVYGTGRSGGDTGIVYDGSKYVIATISSNETRKFYRTVYSTTDFTTFTDHSTLGVPVTVGLNATNDNPLKYLNSRYFLCASNDLYYSTDLTSWTRANVAGGTTASIVSAAYDGTRYYALRSTGVVYVSTDLTSWTANTSGASSPRCIAASSSVVVVTAAGGSSRYSTDGGVTWANLPTIAANVGRTVRFISATNTWVLTTSAPDIYYSTDPTSSWTLATDSASATGYRDIGYNGTYYVATGISTGANVASATSSLASAFTLQAASALTLAATPGQPGGIAGGGGGGAASSTTTSSGGKGGDGYCRVYTW